MKKSELKEIIKDCVRDILYEEGLLSEMIAEVAIGLTKAQTMLTESQSHIREQKRREESRIIEEREAKERRKNLQETKKKMLDAIGSDSMKGVFEDVQPLRSAGRVEENGSPQGPLSGRDPRDPGIDIDSLFGSVGNKWQKLKG